MLIAIWATTWQNQQSECAPSEDSDQPGHPPSLIRVFAVCMKKAWALGYPLSAQWRLWSDWADAQADLSPRWAHSHFVDFVMLRLIFSKGIKLNNSAIIILCKLSQKWNQLLAFLSSFIHSSPLSVFLFVLKPKKTTPYSTKGEQDQQGPSCLWPLNSKLGP